MSTLTSSLYCLARNPAILAKLRAEILSIGKDTVPTYEDARGMRYLRAFVNEVLRMFPPGELFDPSHHLRLSDFNLPSSIQCAGLDRRRRRRRR